MTSCSIPNCTHQAHARGLCPGHYQRWRTTGSISPDTPLKRDLRGMPALDRFQAYVDDSGGPTACHPWIGARDHAGYGRFRADGRSWLATRWLLGHLRGVHLTEGEEACHVCDNPPCVNPKHLYIGDRAANERDKLSRQGHYNAVKTHCKRGHRLSGDNLYVQPSTGGRHCIACRRLRTRATPYRDTA